MPGPEHFREPFTRLVSAQDPKRLADPDAAESFHLEVRWGDRWSKPSVGGIERGFAQIEGAKDLREVLLRWDGGYYAGAEFRILKVTREVVA